MAEIIILAVDDKAENLFLIEELVAEHLPDCRVVKTQSPEEGLEIAAREEISVAILDVQMPGIDGIEMCRRIKADAASAHVPVVLVTAHKSESELRIRGLETGADDFISKPIASVEMVAKIKVMLRIKRAEDELREANASLEEKVAERTRSLREKTQLVTEIIASAQEGIVVYGLGLRYEVWNPFMERLTGRPASEVLGRHPLEVFPILRDTGVMGRIEQALAGGTPKSLDVSYPLPDGRPGWFSDRSGPLRNAKGEIIGVIATVRDITERKQMEQELIRLERLRAVGELSAGVSHNLNNILTNVLGPAQLLKRKTDDPELLREVDDIVTSAIRARDLVHELHLSVRTQGEESLTPVPADLVVQQAVQTSRPRWKDEPEAQGIAIEMITHWGGVPSIKGTEAGLHDILTNFIFNAVDAMHEGGVITIQTQTVEDKVQITFSDTGTGMDEETRRRVFEPFFTTKMDVGSGLGLSTAYNTVTGWGGTIEVDSTPGGGTTFTLRFPVWSEEVAETPEKTADAFRTRSGRILVVDDDKAICSLLSRLLGEQHEVEAVTDGQQALERFAPGKYDVVLIDLGMSGMPGDRLLREMRQIDPAVATVLITGWDLPESDSRVVQFDFQIRKPFTDLDEVEDIVARAIELHPTLNEKTEIYEI
ncbi:response regulator [bacterium]|nr:response regulator [bacterium]